MRIKELEKIETWHWISIGLLILGLGIGLILGTQITNQQWLDLCPNIPEQETVFNFHIQNITIGEMTQ